MEDVLGAWLGGVAAWYSLLLGRRDPSYKIQRRNAIIARTAGEFEMYRSSREGISEGSRSCTCQNGVTQTRVRGGTEIIRTTSAGARASWPCASRRRRRRRPRWRRRRTRRRRPRPTAAPSSGGGACTFVRTLATGRWASEGFAAPRCLVSEQFDQWKKPLAGARLASSCAAQPGPRVSW